MKIKYVQTFWGIPEFFTFNANIWNETFKRIVNSGYSAVEIAIDFTPKESLPFIQEITKKLGIDVITQIHTCSYPISSHLPSDHLKSLRFSIKRAKEYNPVIINCHSGCDYWTSEQSEEFFKEVQQIAEEEKVNLSHETHRSRVLFNPWITKSLLERNSKMNVTADLSHWVLACERLFDPKFDVFWNETLDLVSNRTSLIHARVGTSQSPQILDVNLKEYENEVETFEKWWKNIYNVNKANGKEVLYIEPEYGPDPYMPKVPFTNQPMGDIWVVRDNSMKRLKNILV